SAGRSRLPPSRHHQQSGARQEPRPPSAVALSSARMQYRTFGRTNWQVSEIGFGAWAIGGSWGPQSDADSLAALERALDLGCNFIDTAQGYGEGHSERII